MAQAIQTRPLAELTAIQRDTLAQLDKMDSPTGSELVDALEDSYGNNETVVYATVNHALVSFEQMGLVVSERDGREKHYQTTDAGSRELQADLNWRQA